MMTADSGGDATLAALLAEGRFPYELGNTAWHNAAMAAALDSGGADIAAVARDHPLPLQNTWSQAEFLRRFELARTDRIAAIAAALRESGFERDPGVRHHLLDALACWSEGAWAMGYQLGFVAPEVLGALREYNAALEAWLFADPSGPLPPWPAPPYRR